MFNFIYHLAKFIPSYKIKKMMAIPDKNETIYQVIYTSLTQDTNMKVLKEFGFFNYYILPGENHCK